MLNQNKLKKIIEKLSPEQHAALLEVDLEIDKMAGQKFYRATGRNLVNFCISKDFARTVADAWNFAKRYAEPRDIRIWGRLTKKERYNDIGSLLIHDTNWYFYGTQKG